MIQHFWPFWIGGPAIAAAAVLILAIGGNYLSVTRGYVSACSIITKKSYFHRPEMGGPFGYRTMFVLGIMLGGLLAALTTQGFKPSFDLGSFDRIWGSSIYVKALVLLVGGFLWGYGSRMAKGCTSGNSISGLSRGSAASLAVTVCFMIGGVLVTQLLTLLGGN